MLGTVTGPQRQSLHEIWAGAAKAELRTALDAGDFSLGCVECGRLAAIGQREQSTAAQFDRYGGAAPGDLPRILDFALSNRCNLECVMCSGYFSSRIRRNREQRPPLPAAYDDRFFDELRDFIPHVERAHFKGGEPFLIPENARVWDLMREVGRGSEVSVTTNATVWNEKVDDYVRSLRMELIVSVDAIDPALLEAIRIGVDARQLWRNVDRFQEAATAADVPLTLSMCLMQENWRELGPFLDEATRRGLNPNVVWVWVPSTMDLLRLPPAELAVVHRELLDQRLARDETPATSSIWDEVLHRVGSVMEAQSAVTVRPTRRPSPGAADAEVTSPTALVVRYEGDLATEADVPPWAEFLDPSSWIGAGLQDLPMLLSQATGGSSRLNVDDPGDGSLVGTLSLASGPSTLDLRFSLVPDARDDETTSYRLIIEQDT